VRVDRVSLLVPGQDEVCFLLRVSASQPDAAEVGFDSTFASSRNLQSACTLAGTRWLASPMQIVLL
jgi:hypothetical protein